MAEPEQPRIGRPRAITPEVAAKICEAIAAGGTIRQVCAPEDMPAPSTVYLEIVRNEVFSEQYRIAREAQTARWEDELLEIADDGSNDWMERRREDGSTQLVGDYEHMARSKLRVDTRKWIMSKRLPKKYGERVQAEHSGPGGGPIQHQHAGDIGIGSVLERHKPEGE